MHKSGENSNPRSPKMMVASATPKTRRSLYRVVKPTRQSSPVRTPSPVLSSPKRFSSPSRNSSRSRSPSPSTSYVSARSSRPGSISLSKSLARSNSPLQMTRPRQVMSPYRTVSPRTVSPRTMSPRTMSPSRSIIPYLPSSKVKSDPLPLRENKVDRPKRTGLSPSPLTRAENPQRAAELRLVRSPVLKIVRSKDGRLSLLTYNGASLKLE